MRIDNWKLVASQDLSAFQLYEIVKDSAEENDLAESMPEKVEEMKARFMEVWNGVEAEGPSEWWKNAPLNQKKKKGGKLGKGTDKSGDWDVVKGGTVSKSEFGYLLDASESEAFAVKKLEQPIQESATFQLSYRAATSGGTKNACFCFGALAENDRLHKAGTMIGMDRHGAFDGSWANVNLGPGKEVKLDRNATIDAKVTIDLEHGKLTLIVGETRVEHQIPSNLESVNYIGIYTKGTKTEFTMPTLTSLSVRF